MDFSNILLLSLAVVILIKYNVQVSFFFKENAYWYTRSNIFKVLDKNVW